MLTRALMIVLIALSAFGSAFTVKADDAASSLSWDSATPTARFRGIADWLVDVGARTPAEAYGPFSGKTYQTGDTETFFALDFASNQEPPRRLTATLQLITDHAYWWFEEGTKVDQTALIAAGKRFENDIYPLDHRLFGSEWLPGIDGDPRLFLLHQKRIGGYAVGVFSSRDECAKTICPDPNQHEMLYIGLDFGPVGSPQELTVISHELQHLIQYNVNGNQERWLDEGLAQLAEHLNGFSPHLIASDNLHGYLHDPNFQLNSWPPTSNIDPGVNYAAGYIFCVYLFQRFGTSFIQAILASPYKGLASIEHALKTLNIGQTVDQVFADWTITNYVNNPYVGDGRYSYQSLTLSQRADTVDLTVDEPQTDSVHEYGADYLLLNQAGKYTLDFKGDTQTRLSDARPTSGKWMWWSYNEPRGAARMERAFDLSGTHNAVLAFNTWWDVQLGHDLAHVLVSTDNGKTWKVVAGAHSRNCSLGGACYDGQSQGWVKETVDLSAYDGQQIRVRFEYLTQGGSTGQGFFVDDIRLDAIHYLDDAESSAGGWQTSGFMRVTQTVPQHWLVNVIVRSTPPQVIPVTLDANNTRQLDLTVPTSGVVIVVGAAAPFIQGTANYTLTAHSAPSP